MAPTRAPTRFAAVITVSTRADNGGHVLGEWLMVGLIYLGVAVVLVLAWLAMFAVFGTAITALVNRVTRRFKPGSHAEDAEVEPAAEDDTETGRLQSMLHTD